MDWFQKQMCRLVWIRTVGHHRRLGSTPDAIFGHQTFIPEVFPRLLLKTLWGKNKVYQPLFNWGPNDISNDGMVKLGYPRENWISLLLFHCKSNITHETQEGSTNHNFPLCWGQTPHLCQRHGSQQPCGALPRLAAGTGSQCQGEVPCRGILVPLMMATHAVQGEEEMTWSFGRAKLVDS